MQDADPFETGASRYDAEFTNSEIGRLQRKVVHRYLSKHVRTGMNILEINCGTGEDALFLAGLGCKVTATDASEGMIREAILKQNEHPGGVNVSFQRLSFAGLDKLDESQKFDLVFSDFSGLNCVDAKSLERISAMLHRLLIPAGSMILVLFGRKCHWERLYFLVKGRRSEIRRRNSRMPVMAGPPGAGIPVWYYSPEEINRHMGALFTRVSLKPVGLFIPPSLLNPYFVNKKWLLKSLAFAERYLGNLSLFANFGDHYLIHFRKR